MEKALTLATDAVARARAAGADAADALYYSSASLSVTRRMGSPEGLERSESTGLSLRVFCGSRFAVASLSDVSPATLDESAARAVAMARLAPEDADSILAPSDKLARHMPDLDLYDGSQPEADALQELCREAEDEALAQQGISNSEGADASFSHTEFALATSNGFAGSYRSSHFSLSVSVLAGSGTGMERDYDYSLARHRADLTGAAAIGREAARRTLARLGARKMPTQEVPVMFEPRIARRLLGAFSGAINGSAIARGTSFLKDAMGQEVFSPAISVIDDPLMQRGLASQPFDGEGVAGSRLEIVSQGVLNQWLLDLRCARKLGLETNGRATRGLSSPPSPAPTNLYIAKGALSPAALMKDIKQGFYVTELFGTGVNLVTGDYSQGAAGFWIENGEIAFPVSEVTIAGHLREMFRQLTPADDLAFTYGSNTPTLRIERMTVAGS